MNTKYHTYDNHIKHMIDAIEEMPLNGLQGPSKKRILKLSAIFHDCVYVPMSKTNEEDSVALFELMVNEVTSHKMVLKKDREYMNRSIILKSVGLLTIRKLIQEMNSDEYHKVKTIILNTKDTYDKRMGDELEHYFYLLDTYVLREDFYTLIKYEHRIYNEYKNYVKVDEYIKGRTEFLQSCIDKIQNVNTTGLERLIDYVKTRPYGTVGIFAGSFNPFHKGHKNVLDQARKDFDKIIVVQMQDFAKPQSTYVMPELDALVIKTDKTLVKVFNELKEGHTNATIIRALRNGDDLQHEQNLKQTVLDFDTGVRFTYYLADAGFSHISSSLVRSLPDDLKGSYLV
jgi:cytidyltransferase-like protein